MKLAVAVLSSILLACSVTIANPIDPSATTDVEDGISTFIPSATTSTEASTSPTPDPNGIGLDGLDTLPDIIKELFENYQRKQDGFEEQEEICNSLKSEYDGQTMLVKRLKKKIQVLGYKSQTSGDNQKYYGEIQETKLNLEAQKAKLEDLKKSRKECDSKYKGIEFELELIGIKLVKLVFGGTWDSKPFDQQLYLIGKHPSVQDYLDGLRGKGQSSECNECLGQNHGDQQQQQKPSDQQQHQNPSDQQQQQKPSDQQQQQKPSDQQQQQKPSDQQQHQNPSDQQQQQKPSDQQQQQKPSDQQQQQKPSDQQQHQNPSDQQQQQKPSDQQQQQKPSDQQQQQKPSDQQQHQNPSDQQQQQKPSDQQQQQKPSDQQQQQKPSDQQQQQKPSDQQQHQNPSDQQQHQNPSDQQRQDPQPSSSRPSGSGSSGQKVPSNKRRRISRLVLSWLT
ncbi:hypothetical protein BDEG_25092 [Batrachochytrium dendrobatidis JEL423]|uniref:Uncharacterized protein n=1 Tax=Batrachochytrium dendrobatidis (strain JEL423) TaxID=403673 RepID=A0A177WN14_BATDL|nr:hypothetical protein BDEG_25092 [Batrachochytrium dendrobatidis JEL423]